MKFTPHLALLGTLVIGALWPAAAFSEEGADTSAQTGWDFQLAPYLWATSVSSDLTAFPAGSQSSINAQTNADFLDLLPDLEGAFLGHFEARRGDWSISSDAIYMKLVPDGQMAPFSLGPVSSSTINVDAKVKGTVLELAGLYRLGQWSIGGAQRDQTTVSLEGLAGLRYSRFEVETKITTQLSGPLGQIKRQVEALASLDKDSLDPIFGARVLLEPDPNWLLTFRGDIGGFGVGSELTWNLSGLVGYRAWENVTLAAGYRAMYFKLEGSNSGAAVDLDLLFHGPLIAAAFHF